MSNSVRSQLAELANRIDRDLDSEQADRQTTLEAALADIRAILATLDNQDESPFRTGDRVIHRETGDDGRVIGDQYEAEGEFYASVEWDGRDALSARIVNVAWLRKLGA